MKKWTQVNKRLKTIIAPKLKIAFNKSNIFHITGRSEFNMSHFYVKLNGKILWESQKDSAYCNYAFYDRWDQYAELEGFGRLSPANIIAQYLDTPKDKLLEFDEPSGLKFILWACDKRIGKERLSKMRFTKWALPIVKERVPEYNLEPIIYQPCPIIYSCNEFTVFDVNKYNSYWEHEFLFVIANSIDYSTATHATNLTNKCETDGYWKIPSKKVLELTEEQIILAKNKIQQYVENIKNNRKENNESENKA